MEGKKMTFGRGLKWVLCCLLIGAVIGGSFGVGYTLSKQPQETNYDGASYMLKDNGYTGNSDQNLLANPLVGEQVKQVTEEVKDAVVVIITRAQQDVQTIFGQSYVQEYSALGSGVIFREENDRLYILTNAHVLEGAEEAYLYFDEETTAPVYLVGESVSNDLAVIYVNKSELSDEILNRLKVAALGDSDTVRKGDLAIAIGSPYSQNMAHTTTVGIVTGVDQEFEIEDRVLNVIQTDAALNPGNSGGALFNKNGEVIGINSAGIRSDATEGLGFAISINRAKEVVDKIFESGSIERASIGIISSSFIDKERAELYRVPSGLFIYQLEAGGAAERAGLEVGDVITSVNGIALTDENSLNDILATLHGGDTVEVEVIRNRDSQNVLKISITLDSITDTNTNLPTEAGEESTAA